VSGPLNGPADRAGCRIDEGKVAAAKFFVNFILRGVHAKTVVITTADRSALDVPDRGFLQPGVTR
jgi:hypothetical protein